MRVSALEGDTLRIPLSGVIQFLPRVRHSLVRNWLAGDAARWLWGDARVTGDQMVSLDLSALLQAARAGEDGAVDELFAALYTDLKLLAHAQLLRTRHHGETLDTTALVHEAYVRLAEPSGLAAEDRAHFLNLAARVMRHVVVDLARRRAAIKRGAALRISWPEGFEPTARESERSPSVLALDEALGRLELESPRLAQLTELRFFGGLPLAEIASLLNVSDRTLKRDWRRARAFLFAELS